VAIDNGMARTDRIVAGYVNTDGVTWLDGGADDGDFPTAKTVVCVSSAGKWIVAACIAILVRQGDLDPNLPVRTFLPELPTWAAPIRLHHLIHHTSGLPQKAVTDYRIRRPVPNWNNESVLRNLAAMPKPAAEPGTVFAYNEIGYACLTVLAERAAGRPIAEIAKKHLFTPLGMISTRFRTGPPSQPPTFFVHPSSYAGQTAPHTGDTIWSTARDMLRWAEAMQTGALGPRLTALLRQPGKLRHGTTVPYTWGSFLLSGNTGPTFAHSGWWPGCFTYVAASPSTATSAVVIAFTDNPRLAEALGRRLVGLEPPSTRW
jgi:CubicO group peptidase (beta-lactamase class C family)